MIKRLVVAAVLAISIGAVIALPAAAQEPSGTATTEVEGLFQNGYALVDARLVYESDNRRYTIGLYANNIFDVAYKTDGQEFSSIGSIRTAYYGAPRQLMIRAGVRF